MTKRRGKGDGSIYQRESDGLWVASIRIDRGKRKTVYGKTRQEVAKKLKAVQRDIEQGTLITARAQSVEAFLRYWLDIHKAEIAESTYRTYIYLMKPVYPHIGSITLTKLTPDQIQRMYAAISKDHAISYIKQIHRVLTAAFNDAILWNRLSKNPCKVVVLPKKQYNEEEVQHALDAEQCQTLIDTAKGTPLEVFVVLALGTALRRGEMLALEWSDINLDEKTISITKTLSYLPDDQGHSRSVVGEPKSRTSKRTLTLPDFVIDALRIHRTRQKKERMAAPAWSDKNLVFPDSKGEYRNVKTVQKQFNRLLEQAGLPDIHIHDLRHSCATLLLKMGVPMKVVQEILGHSSITITMDVYGHVTPGMQEDAMNKIDGIFKREKEG